MEQLFKSYASLQEFLSLLEHIGGFLLKSETIAIIALVYAVKAFRSSIQISKVNFLFQLTQSHREIWSKIHDSKLTRIRDRNADVSYVGEEERRHVTFIILNMHTLYRAHKSKLYDFDIPSQLDTGQFFNLPIPNHVWEECKAFYTSDYVDFIRNAKKRARIFAESDRNSLKLSKLNRGATFFEKIKGLLLNFSFLTGRFFRHTPKQISVTNDSSAQES